MYSNERVKVHGVHRWRVSAIISCQLQRYLAIVVIRWRTAPHVYRARRNSPLGIFSVIYDETACVARSLVSSGPRGAFRIYLPGFPRFRYTFALTSGEILTEHADLIYKLQNPKFIPEVYFAYIRVSSLIR